MLLVIDIGNTQTVMGLWDGASILDATRFRSVSHRTADEWGLLTLQFLDHLGYSDKVITAVAMASVVPPATRTLGQTVQAYFHTPPFVVGPGVKTGMPILYEDPKSVGADRIANAVAAYHALGGPCIVIDLGTATTFDIVTRDGGYAGGIIAPGIEISAEALYRHAAKLPRVDICRPPKVIGTTTTHSMQSGLYYGYLGLIERIAAEIESALSESPHFVATGGLAYLFRDASPYMQFQDPHLTLKGIAQLYELNTTIPPGRP